ncbi:MAG: transferrin-binding protein-like solute binding protein [Deltaproteobacteria bacterium]|nr:transferrin-binding protein-like solute binding protein [Deltaproteobacteria bacterium]
MMKQLSSALVLAFVVAGCGGGGGGGPVGSGLPPGGSALLPAPSVTGVGTLDLSARTSNQGHGIDPRETWEGSYDFLGNLEPASGSRSIGGLVHWAVGQKDGITYGQAKAGPTDTLDVDIIGDHWHQLPKALQAVLERGGKAWSYRLLLTPLADQRVRISTAWTRHRCPSANTACGSSSHLSLKQSRWIKDGSLVTDPDTWYLNPAHAVYREAGITVEKDQAYFAGHEMGHVLGLRHDGESGGSPISPLSPYRLMGKGLNRHEIVTPHESELVELESRGYTRAGDYPDGSADNPFETYGYAAWGEWAEWGVKVVRELIFSENNPPTDSLLFGALAEGTRSTEPLGDGAYTWTGSLLAVDTGTAEPVRGDARIALSGSGGTIRFTGLRRVEDTRGPGVSLTGWRESSLEYGIRLDPDRMGFTDDVGARVTGAFYGPNHEEAGGTLNDQDNRIMGAFGAPRTP